MQDHVGVNAEPISVKVYGLVQAVKMAGERLNDLIDLAPDSAPDLVAGDMPRFEDFATVEIEVE